MAGKTLKHDSTIFSDSQPPDDLPMGLVGVVSATCGLENVRWYMEGELGIASLSDAGEGRVVRECLLGWMIALWLTNCG